MIANFCYHSENIAITKFRYDCEIFAMVAKFSQSLRNFHNVITKILHSPASVPASIQPPFLQFHLTFLHPGLMKSPRTRINQHRYEAKLEMKAEVPKTCKTIKNNLETKSVALNGPAHANWLNSYD